MEDFSDSTNRYIILFVFFVLYLYFSFIKTKIMTKLSWKDIKCNPLFMLVGSIFDSDSSQHTFDKCVKLLAKKDLHEKHHKNMDKFNHNVDNAINVLKNNNEKDNKEIHEKQEELLDLISNTNNQIEDTIEKQNKINKAIQESSGPITDLSSKINQISSQFKDTMLTFLNSGLVDNLKDLP